MQSVNYWMIKRVIDISEGAYLHTKNKQLCVDREGATIAIISIEDLGVLILDNPAIVITQSVLVLCQKYNVAIVYCDEKHLPISLNLPLWSGHSLHTKNIRDQVSLKKTRAKRLWQQIVKAKITEQALSLDIAGKSNTRLLRFAEKVKSGDPENIEAQAAREYWKTLMGEDFRRNQIAGDINNLLNYGYSIMRAMIARCIVSTGLHPSLGLHHKNQYNSLCLSDDLMEPFRPWIDTIVHKMRCLDQGVQITRETKQQILGLLSQDVLYENKKMPLMVASHYLAARLKQALTKNDLSLIYPQRITK
jgi:CRISPR-associated protein Cas1